jgi:hypothetical protein
MPRPISQHTLAVLAALPGTINELTARTGIPRANIQMALHRARKRGSVTAVKPDGSPLLVWSRVEVPTNDA